ncbi:MAG: ABC transporter permease [Bacteroidales bacterium]|nr:ABC transporter permease [Bacteroidales bacterium]
MSDSNFKLIRENIRISLESIKSHRVRSSLTVLIIAFGIMALVGIFTAIDALKYSLKENFTRMGANTFSISNRSLRVSFGHRPRNAKAYSIISYQQAQDFKQMYHFPAVTSVTVRGTGIATIKYQSLKTNPNVSVMGVDENYLTTSGMDLAEGRNFTLNEVQRGNHVVILGSEIVSKLFPNKENPIGKIVSVGPGRYRVIGVLKSKGSSSGFSGDRTCLLALNNVRQYFSRPNMNYNISVMVTNSAQMDPAIGQATGTFRLVRKDKLGQPDSFSIEKSDNLANMFISLTSKIRYGAAVIGLITLLGAAIGLMNIMLVSVTERTREIGIRKALGARRHTIRNQFLFEALVITQIGGLLGIVMGIIMGNLVSFFTHSAFIIPWLWILLGVVISAVVALLSGIIPAVKAARLDPIESLRYE